MVAVAGPISEKIGPRCTVEEAVGVHEAAHVVIQFLLGCRLRGASIIPWEGHSLGRASSRKPTPEDLQTPLYTDDQVAHDYALLGGLNRAELEGRHREVAVLLLAAGAALGAGAGRAQGDLRQALPADSLPRVAQGSAPLTNRRGEGPPQSGGVVGGAAVGAGACSVMHTVILTQFVQSGKTAIEPRRTSPLAQPRTTPQC
jgi:hypothetical protein